MNHSKIFVIIMVVALAAIAIVFNFFPRSTFSPLERRELADFPEFDKGRLADGSFTSDISSWFSDTEPYRDELMTMSMQIKSSMGITPPGQTDEDALAFHAPDENTPAIDVNTNVNTEPEKTQATDTIGAYTNNINADEENTKIAHSGILVVGKAPNARAMMAFGATGKAGTEFAQIVSKYKETFGPDMNVYCMAIPNSIEFYCPDKARNITKPQIATINNIYQHLINGAKGIDCYTPLSQHVDEDIFLRTDHHWAPLGAYYAAQAFANAAGVPFKDLSEYEQHVIHNFVGTMYGYSKDIAVKQSPEDFYYWTPTGVDYNTTYIVYNVDKNLHITSESKPYKGQFFNKFKDGSGNAYLTFMGGDQKITQVRTSTKNGRRLVIFKDSFGNPLPGYLFHSFEEIHVIDYRYFTRNFVKYAHENNITDILFAHSIFMCLGGKAISTYNRFLKQGDNSFSAPKPATKAQETNDTTPALAEPKKEPAEPAPLPSEEPSKPATAPTLTSEPVETPEAETPTE